jgi:hypothetical protein
VTQNCSSSSARSAFACPSIHLTAFSSTTISSIEASLPQRAGMRPRSELSRDPCASAAVLGHSPWIPQPPGTSDTSGDPGPARDHRFYGERISRRDSGWLHGGRMPSYVENFILIYSTT